MSGDEHALEQARRVFDLVVSGWDDDPTDPKPGGVFWTQASWSDTRNTVSNAPGAELGLQLYQLTDDSHQKSYYGEWAKRMYDWVNEYLRAPNGLYWDHIKMDGSIVKWVFTYNQGTMIGANVLLYQVTGERKYLAEAKRIANTALNYFDQDRLHGEDLPFAAIFFRNLLFLDRFTDGRRYVDALREYADWLWNEQRDPETNLIRRNDQGSTDMIQQAALVQLYASLAWVRPHYDQLT